MISWWGGYLRSNSPILKESNDVLPLAIFRNLKTVFQAKIGQNPTLCISDKARDFNYCSVFA